MDAQAKTHEIFEKCESTVIKMFTQINEGTNSYRFEKEFRGVVAALSHALYQQTIGNEKVSKNERMQLLTGMGEITMQKSHPLAVAPGGFKISPYLQEQMCRVGSKMPFEEGEEELSNLLGIKVNAEQLERLCRHYGEQLEQIGRREVYKDSMQLHLPFKKPLYVLIDGSMLPTREKEKSWKEVKLCRMFLDRDRVEGMSKKRNHILDSRYVAHPGGHEAFLDKVLDAVPWGSEPVFIAGGAKWIWNWVDELYPHSTQILDFFHCKEHLCSFAKAYFSGKEGLLWVEGCSEQLKGGQADAFFETIRKLAKKNKHLSQEKDKLLTYLKNNKKRINYGKFIQEGLLMGSGAVESAKRDVIQKRMKLSGQRWTLQGARQMLNLRACCKSGKHDLIKKTITDYKNVS